MTVSKEDRFDDSDDSDQSEDVVIYQTAEDIEVVQDEQLHKIARLRPRHHLWEHKAGSYYIVLAFILGYDTLILFTNFFDRQGILFLVFYLLSLIFIGFPLLYMEMTLGQFTSYNAFSVFRRMAPAMSGVGVVSLIFNFLIMITDHTMMHHFVSLFSHSANIFTNEYPWDGCHSSFNDYNCRELRHTCEQFQKQYKELSMKQLGELGLEFMSVGQICYQTQLLNEMEDDTDSHWKLTQIDSMDFAKWLTSESMGQYMLRYMRIEHNKLKYITWPTQEFIINMFLAWTAVYFICLTGKRFISNMARFTVLFTLAVLFTFCFVFLFIAPPRWHYLNPIRATKTDTMLYVIVSAIACVVLSLRLGQGGIVYLGSQYPFKNAPAMDCIVICAAASIFPILYTVVHLMFTDSYMMELMEGDFSKFPDIDQRQQEVYFYRTGHRLFHMTFFLQALKLLKSYQPFMIVLFSAMGILISIMNKVVRAEIIISSILEVFPVYANRISRRMFIHFIICLCFCFTFIFFCEDGLEIMVSLENLVYPALAIVIVFSELGTVCWCYGGRRLIVNIMAMNNKRNQDKESKLVANITKVIIIGMWSVVIPLCLFVSIVTMFVRTSLTKTENFHTRVNQMTDPPVLMGIGLASIVPVVVLLRVLRQYGKSKNWRPVFRPDPELWGPRSSTDRMHAEKLEKMFRTG